MPRALLPLLALMSASVVHGEDWPHWRGPRHDGTSTERNLPLKWTATENIAWKTPIPGVGHSSPVIHGNRIFVTTCLLKENRRVLVCVDRLSGQIIWQRDVLESPLEPKHHLNSHASSTPATDGKHVWTSFLRLRPKTPEDGPAQKPREVNFLAPNLVPEMVITCFDMDGNKVWEKVPGRFYSRHGYSSSVLPYKDLIILNGDQDALAYLVALDKRTGEEKWRVDRPNRTRSYCVPIIADAGGKTQMVLTGSMGVTSYNPENGELYWSIKGPTEQYVASPVLGEGLFFMTAGFPEYHNWTVRLDGQGDVTKSHIAWHDKRTISRKAAYVPSPIAVPGHFWVISDQGWLSSFDAKSGERSFYEQLGRHQSGSPVLADGHVYITDDEGTTFVLKAGGTFDVVSRNSLGDACYSSPAISQGQLYIRTQSYLWCIGKR